MEPEDRQKLIHFVKQKHLGFKRKYTGEPYYNHVLSVAEMAEQYEVKYGFEIGLCHDLLEDTDVTAKRLHDFFKRKLKYDDVKIFFIVERVIELTDLFTNKSLPYINRTLRKQCEAIRLHTISQEAQIIKCCDLIDNTSSIVEHDPGFALKYLSEKREILKGFKLIDGKIKTDVWNCLIEAEERLGLKPVNI